MSVQNLLQKLTTKRMKTSGAFAVDHSLRQLKAMLVDHEGPVETQALKFFVKKYFVKYSSQTLKYHRNASEKKHIQATRPLILETENDLQMANAAVEVFGCIDFFMFRTYDC